MKRLTLALALGATLGLAGQSAHAAVCSGVTCSVKLVSTCHSSGSDDCWCQDVTTPAGTSKICPIE